ncbi:hypothetical protein [Thalassovita sp.]|jgi:hypothetical protein
MARTQKRWMKSVIETSKSEMPALPWARQSKAAKAAASKPAQDDRRAG